MKLLLRCGLIVQGIFIIMITGNLSSGDGPYWLVYTVHDSYPSLVYRANPDGSNIQLIADGDVYAWSPDGQWILYQKSGNSMPYRHNLFRMRWDGSLKKQLTYSEEFKRGARYSPDGQWILFLTNDSTNASRVHRMRTDGSEQEIIIEGDSFSLPEWSPDGQWLVFAQYLSDERESRVFLMRPDGSDHWFIAKGNNPTWSPDGRWIAFSCGERTANICRIPASDAIEGVGESELWLEDASDLAWSWDGQWVAFVRFVPVEVIFLSDEDHRAAIFRAHVDSVISEEVILLSGHSFNPVWSPDGQWIAFMHNWEMQTTLMRIRPDGSNKHGLTPLAMMQPMSPLWSAQVNTSFHTRSMFMIGCGFMVIGMTPSSRLGSFFRRQTRQSRVH